MKNFLLLLFASLAMTATIIDRTAIVVDKHAILDSHIDRDLRMTAFLNNEPADFSAASRKKAGSRLIDQELIRQQVRSGSYPVAPQSETSQMLEQVKRGRFTSDPQFQNALARSGINEAELRDRLSWQLTVLRFIDTRFRAQVVVSDQDIQQYYDTHRGEVESKSLDDEARSKVVEVITADRVNKLFEDWLDQSRKSARIVFLEKSLS